MSFCLDMDFFSSTFSSSVSGYTRHETYASLSLIFLLLVFFLEMIIKDLVRKTFYERNICFECGAQILAHVGLN